MKRIVPLAALSALVLLVAARKPDDPKHENWFSPVSTPASDIVGLAVDQAQAQQEFLQLGVKITNKSGDDMLIVMRDEAEFVLPSGSFTAKPSALFKGPFIIPPKGTKGHTFKVDGGTGFHVDAFTFKPRGFYSAPDTGEPVSVPEFQLPPSQNDFTSGPFACKLKDTKQATDETTAAFACTYDGKGIGIVDAARMAVKVPDGKEFANAARKPPRDILLPGESTKVVATFRVDAKVVDMQFATLQVLWRDTLSESPMKPVALEDWAFQLDPARTAEANE